MSLAEMLSVVRSLPHQDKLRLLYFLAGELVREEGVPTIQPGAEYPIWSPYDAFNAAGVLAQALENERSPS